MNQLTKAQLTVGLLAYFATLWHFIWSIIQEAYTTTLTSTALLAILLGLIVMLIFTIILSIVLLGLLEWVKIFDLKTNAILTLIILVTIQILVFAS